MDLSSPFFVVVFCKVYVDVKINESKRITLWIVAFYLVVKLLEYVCPNEK